MKTTDKETEKLKNNFVILGFVLVGLCALDVISIGNKALGYEQGIISMSLPFFIFIMSLQATSIYVLSYCASIFIGIGFE